MFDPADDLLYGDKAVDQTTHLNWECRVHEMLGMDDQVTATPAFLNNMCVLLNPPVPWPEEAIRPCPCPARRRRLDHGADIVFVEESAYIPRELFMTLIEPIVYLPLKKERLLCLQDDAGADPVNKDK
jgi:hypothetical protein